MINFRTLLVSVALCSGGLPASGAFATCADLALVLAIDGSGSINERDFLLQQAGYAAAFADGRVQRALKEAGIVDVAVVLWGDEEIAPQVVGWQRIAGDAGAEAVARRILTLPRKVTGDTGIGRGLWAALDLLEDGQACAPRRIINVSGDGQESYGPFPSHRVPLVLARKRAEAMGVTVNGLAITAESPDLAEWYRTRVITGAEAFVMVAGGFDDFEEAIARKLAREIALPAMAAAGGKVERQP